MDNAGDQIGWLALCIKGIYGFCNRCHNHCNRNGSLERGNPVVVYAFGF